ncbi:helix-turn-helix domain-containing protein [Variovorax terrae]|uniref:Helix-turn-helix domain-containing protein n=1 Tax=Variovorax terrae TaxID=2923278 RepID=A0A9X1VVG2_9BURK|nr:helix-turn-helix domain-containing protein [Variovorax terrae]MCJ0762617.1 helix-turn-helix domain-containing protein [Variovorax terrae]
MTATRQLGPLVNRLPHTRSHAGVPGQLHTFSTGPIPHRERFEAVRAAHLGRMTLQRPDEGRERPFDLHIQRILGLDTHLMENISDGLIAERTPAQAARDGVDYLSINLITQGSGCVVEHQGQVQRLRAGMGYFVDSAEPIRFHMPRHSTLSLFLPRERVIEALGQVPRQVPAQGLLASGVGAALRAQMRAIAANARRMAPEERIVLISACTDVALLALRSASEAHRAAPQHTGLYHAACQLIEARCADPALTPDALAQALGCSRATLYRAFRLHGDEGKGEGITQRIWEARLEAAARLLASPANARLSLAGIALRCGFLDASGFSHMFRRRYGMAPREARACGSQGLFTGA